MKKIIQQILPSLALVLFLSASAFAQTKIGGKVMDADSKEPLIGVSIGVKGAVTGTISDSKGNFSLSTNKAGALTIVVSMVGYERQEIPVKGNKTDFQIALKEQSILGQDVVVSASRVEESVMQSPVSVERMDIRAIRETPAASFYDALRNIKGVEMSTQSVSFSSIGMRGFNSNGNVRVVQLIDGMDNQAPGLNFSVGNIVGISELDLQSVDLLPGAASALYGPNAINGIILMDSKSPFLFQGLSAQVKTGAMHASNRSEATTPYGDISIRYAKAFNNKLAFKLNFNQLTAEDWQSTDNRDQSLLNGTVLGPGSRGSNLAFNGINVYGDETNVNMLSSLRPLLGVPTNPLTVGINQISAATGGLLTPTAILGYIAPNVNISREGYAERDIASYANRNIKFNAALHYRFNDKVELILQGSYGQGTTMYTGADRYSIKNFSMGQYKAELKGSNFFVRAYTTQENSGDAYATGTLGQLVNEAAKPSATWYPQYFSTFAGLALNNFGTVLQTNILKGVAPASAVGLAIASTQASFPFYHGTARSAADVGRLVPGTAAFNAAVDAIKKKPLPSGAKFTDKSALYHLEGMYNFTEKLNNKLELIVGANYRQYALNSEGTLFALKDNGEEFTITEFGAYAQASKKFFADHFKLTGSLRFDKNENFQGVFSPRLSGVFTQGTSNFRASVQTGFRIPTTQDQYINLLTPSARLLGGLAVVQDRYKLSGNSFTLQSILASPTDPSKWVTYRAKEWKPEQVQTYEIGYKGMVTPKVLVDFYAYQSNFTNFSAGQVVAQPSTTIAGSLNYFSFPSNVENEVVTNGWGLGVDYDLGKRWTLASNVSYNAVKDNGGLADYQLGFNTPNYRTNVSIGNRNLGNSGWGFNATWRYQEKFVWQSSFVNQVVNQQQLSVIPAFSTLDMQVSKKVSQIKSIIKVGGTNLGGKLYTTGWGNPFVGSIYYVSITFDELLN
jgi:outer membrane receptor protein involved in Fe transport